MTDNGVLTPRRAGCWVCANVASIEDVTVRLFAEDGSRKRGYTDAVEYLRGIGHDRSNVTFKRDLRKHADHVERDMIGAVAAPGALTRIAPPGPVQWMDVNANAMAVGNEALSILNARLDTMEDRDLTAVAKLGLVASHKEADLIARGRKQLVSEALALGAGFDSE